MKLKLSILLILLGIFFSFGQTSNKPSVIAYWSGNTEKVSEYKVNKLSHIIFSFLHLNGAEISFDSPNDRLQLQNLVNLKKKNPNLKIMFALGGWEGCKTCSEVFSSPENRKIFAKSVKKILEETNTDGIDIDWEYPTIPGPEGHLYQPSDRDNFTSLIKTLRQELGNKYEISFAIGGFLDAIKKSIDVLAVAPYVDRLNLMSYDLYSGGSKVTGHHTALYSNKIQTESLDNSVKYLVSIGFPKNKIVIGAAFYGRSWENVSANNNGLYQKGKFKDFVIYSNYKNYMNADYKVFWDKKSKANYAYNKKEGIFFSFESPESIREKTKYLLQNNLGGIMFWELSCDIPEKGLLDEIIVD